MSWGSQKKKYALWSLEVVELEPGGASRNLSEGVHHDTSHFGGGDLRVYKQVRPHKCINWSRCSRLVGMVSLKP